MGSKKNNELVNDLVDEDNIKTQKVERVLRLVDRGIFVHPHKSTEAYVDNPFRTSNLHPGQIHISAPSIYCTVLEMLDLHKGQSFLNIGSGSGYLSALVGFLIGENGTSHGVELHSNVIDHARNALHLFQSQKFVSGYDWCRPQFVHGNAFLLAGISKRYDRIYVGAQIEQSELSLFSEMLKEDGIMIVPVRNGGETKFQRVKRTSNGFEIKDFMRVQFAELIQPREGDRTEPSTSSRKRKIVEEPSNPNDDVTADLLSLFHPPSLEVLASSAIRKRIADALRVKLPIAIVQRVNNTRTHTDVLEDAIREFDEVFGRHARVAARRAALNAAHMWDNDPIPMIPIPIFGRLPGLNARLHFADRNRNENLMLPIADRMDDDDLLDVDINVLEERMEAAFNNGVRAAAAAVGDRPLVEQDVEQLVMDGEMMNLLRREATLRARYEQLHRENDNVNDSSDDDVDDDDEEDEEDDDDLAAYLMPALIPPARVRGTAEEREAALRARLREEEEREPAENAENDVEVLGIRINRDREAMDDFMMNAELLGFRPFRMRTRRGLEDDDTSSTDEQRRNNCAKCCRRVCRCPAPSLKVMATRVVRDLGDSRFVRVAKAQSWVRCITRLTGTCHNPQSFAEQLPIMFEGVGASSRNGRLAIEDWYLQTKKDMFMSKRAALEEAVRETGRLQFEQEINDFQNLATLAESKHTSNVTFVNEEDSISRFEKEIVGLFDQIPLPENVKKALKWNIFREY